MTMTRILWIVIGLLSGFLFGELIIHHLPRGPK